VRLFSFNSTIIPICFSTSPSRVLAAAALGISGLIIAACSGPATSLSPTSFVPQRSLVLKASQPVANPTSTPTPIPFKFQTVDDPNSNHNQVNGINQLGRVVGSYGAGQGSNIWQSYMSDNPYGKFLGLDDPGAQGTVAMALSSNKIQAGYVLTPVSLLGTWGWVRVGGLWTVLSDPNEGSLNYAVTKFLGINDSEYVVGYYTNSSGTAIPMLVDVPNLAFTDLHPPGAINAEATGINGKGNISGWEQTSSTPAQGFYLKAGTYYPFSYPGSSQTEALSLNWQDQIVGTFVDSKGSTHGFMLTGPTYGGSRQVWQKIDAPGASGGTWVTGISNHDVICGYYVDGSGVQHGFVATP
jgi:hypothetical protein